MTGHDDRQDSHDDGHLARHLLHFDLEGGGAFGHLPQGFGNLTDFCGHPGGYCHRQAGPVGDVSRSVDHAGALGQRRLGGHRFGGFVHPHAFAGEGQLVRAQAVGLDQTRIRRDLLPMCQHQDVTGDNLGRVDMLVGPIAQDGGFEHQQPVQGFQLLLGAVLLEEAQANTQDDDAKNEISGQPASAFPREITDRKGQDGCKEQDEDEIIDKLLE